MSTMKENDDPVVVVGMSLRFPGDATSPSNFWRMLCEAQSAHSHVPSNRFHADSFYHPVSGHTGSLYATTGHFMKQNIAAFDPQFFSISPVEANTMDPQQRMLLEVVYESIENAGMTMERMNSSQTACYVGAFTREYEAMLTRDEDTVSPYQATGAGMAMLANRISWFFNLKGPSVSLDTACSSSLTGFHLGCQNLHNGEAEMAIIAGANLFFSPDHMIPLSAMNFLSPDGKCYSFDQKANGYARGEGFASVVLKKLSAALRDGDTIRAIVRSTALNHDGRTPGITLPNGEAQKNLIIEAHRTAGLEVENTGYFEAHGTGTLVGDPIEAAAISVAFGDRRKNAGRPPLFVGAVKTNIGHLEGTAGLAGLIKSILVVEQGLIPANLWLEKINSKIPADKWHLQFPTSLTKWPEKGVRRACVNSFGYGGANSHAIIDDAHHYLREHHLKGIHATVVDWSRSDSIYGHQIETIGSASNPNGSHSSPVQLLVWSAADQKGLERISSGLTKYLAQKRGSSSDLLQRLAFTLSSKRTAFTWRNFVLASSVNELQQKLNGSLSKGIRSPSQKGRVGFLFTGQGAQWSRMGSELLETYPVFRSSLAAASGFLMKELEVSWSLLEELTKPDEQSSIHDPLIAQPLCTALQVALVELLSSWGVKPARVVGHSSGEIAAAYCCGAISREEAWRLSYYRGMVSSSRGDGGSEEAMLAAGLSEQDLLPHMRAVSSRLGKDELDIACLNSPTSTTVSGSAEAVDCLGKILSQAGVATSRLRVRNAYHSRFMEPLARDYRAKIEDFTGDGAAPLNSDTQGNVVMFSSVTGEAASKASLKDAGYWVENMTSKVRFFEALRAAASNSYAKKSSIIYKRSDCALDLLIEIGPHSVLQSAVRQTLGQDQHTQNIRYFPTLVRNVSGVESILQLAGNLFCNGIQLEIARVNNHGPSCLDDVDCSPPAPRMLVDLPPYPWNHETEYWQESRLSKEYRFRKHVRHDLLGAQVRDWTPLEPRWRHWVRVQEMPWLQDHRINGNIIFPAAGYLSMVVEASRQMADQGRTVSGYRFRNVVLHQVLQVPDNKMGIEATLSMHPYSDNMFTGSTTWSEFRVSSFEEEYGWREHCRGLVEIQYDTLIQPSGESVDDGMEQLLEATQMRELFESARERCPSTIESRQMYASIDSIGIQYGPCFRLVEDVQFSGDGEALGSVRVPDLKAIMPKGHFEPHVIHPTTLDCILQLLFPALGKGGSALEDTMIPTLLNEVWISSRLMAKPPGYMLRGYSHTGYVDRRETRGEIFIMDEECAEPLLLIRDLRSKAVTGGDLSATSVERRMDCFHVSWMPDAELISTPQLAQISHGPLWQVPRRVMVELELLAICYIRKALKVLRGRSTPVDLPVHSQKYIEWMKRQERLLGEGLLQHYDDTWKEVVDDETGSRLEALSKQAAAASIDGRIMDRLGPRIVEILDQKTDMLDLLVEDGALDELYDKGIGNEVLRQHVAKYVELLSFKNPELDILEVGAGTGGTTGAVLEALSHRSPDSEALHLGFKSYTYTDISAGFFEKAKDKFKDWSNAMTFRVLDIEKEPQPQGFEERRYDIVIASNVLHATSRLENTVNNVSKLLKPGGKLVLVEICRPLSRHALTFGLLRGWWMAEERWRAWGPIVSEKEWERLLSRSGFGGLDHVIRDYEEPYHHISMLVSTHGWLTQEAALDDVSIITSSKHEIGRLESLLASKLSEAGISCSTVGFEDATRVQRPSKACIVLAEVYESVLENMDAENYQTLQDIVAASYLILWVTAGGVVSPKDPRSGIVTGLSRVVRSENQALRFTTLDLPGLAGLDDAELGPATTRICAMMQHMIRGSGSIESEYAEMDGVVHIARLVPAVEVTNSLAKKGAEEIQHVEFGSGDGSGNSSSNGALRLDIKTQGMLGSLYFRADSRHDLDLQPTEIEVEVLATGLNFRDVVVALGQMPESCFGCECAGIVTRVGTRVTDFQLGDRVCAVTVGSFGTYYRAEDLWFQKIPDQMSFEQAAAIPLAYCTAYYSLIDVARLSQGESVLIHAAAGGVGQAAIVLAQMQGAEVFATVGTKDKKRLVAEHYGIPQDHIFSSRDLSFVKAVRRMTGGRGVDVVLNSLSGEALRESWRCVAPFGRFVEVGKRDIHQNGLLEMKQFAENVSFTAVEYEGMLHNNKKLGHRIMADVMELVLRGIAKPAEPLTLYSYSQIEDALRLMQAGKHTGKIVLVPHVQDVVPVLLAPPSPKYFDNDSSYLLVGGLGGLGRSMIKWMVDHDAKHIISISRSGDRSTVAQGVVAEMRRRGANIRVLKCDVGNRDDLRMALEDGCQGLPPIKGCIQAAMVLRDSLFPNMSLDDFKASLHSKVAGSWNLHQLLPRDLDFFVMLASTSGITGTRGQANYAAGNTFQDALSRHRLSLGLPALTIDLGLVLSAGYVAENNQETIDTLQRWGFLGIRESEFLELIEMSINPNNPKPTDRTCQLVTGLQSPTVMRSKGLEDPYYYYEPLFSHLRAADIAQSSLSNDQSSAEVIDALKGAKTFAEASDIAAKALANKICKVLGIQIADVDFSKPLHAYGVDSLVAVVVRYWLFRDLRADLAVADILGSWSFEALGGRIAAKSEYVDKNLTGGDDKKGDGEGENN